jgi:GTP-binding protein
VTETDSSDIYEVSGRGQLHLTVLIETMRREGFELLVGPPTVITRKENGKVRVTITRAIMEYCLHTHTHTQFKQCCA